MPIVLAILLLIGEVCIIGIMTVYFRDLAFIVPVVMQTLSCTPVYYPITMMPARLQQIIGYNPLYWYVELFRKPIYENASPPVAFDGGVLRVVGVTVYFRVVDTKEIR